MKPKIEPAWSYISDFDDADSINAALVNELKKELAPDHQLFGCTATAIARANPNDDVLFKLEGGRAAIVHLTWKGSSERTPWPATTIFTSLDEAMKSVLTDVAVWLKNEEE